MLSSQVNKHNLKPDANERLGDACSPDTGTLWPLKAFFPLREKFEGDRLRPC